MDRSNANGDRLNETRAINTSLSALGNVFVAIANKSSHVSGRTVRRPSRHFGLDFFSVLLFINCIARRAFHEYLFS